MIIILIDDVIDFFSRKEFFLIFRFRTERKYFYSFNTVYTIHMFRCNYFVDGSLPRNNRNNVLGHVQNIDINA